MSTFFKKLMSLLHSIEQMMVHKCLTFRFLSIFRLFVGIFHCFISRGKYILFQFYSIYIFLITHETRTDRYRNQQTLSQFRYSEQLDLTSFQGIFENFYFIWENLISHQFSRRQLLANWKSLVRIAAFYRARKGS